MMPHSVYSLFVDNYTKKNLSMTCERNQGAINCNRATQSVQVDVTEPLLLPISKLRAFSSSFLKRAFLKSIYRHHKSFPFTSLFQFFFLRSPSPWILSLWRAEKLPFKCAYYELKALKEGSAFYENFFPVASNTPKRERKKSEGKKAELRKESEKRFSIKSLQRGVGGEAEMN